MNSALTDIKKLFSERDCKNSEKLLVLERVYSSTEMYIAIRTTRYSDHYWHNTYLI